MVRAHGSSLYLFLDDCINRRLIHQDLEIFFVQKQFCDESETAGVQASSLFLMIMAWFFHIIEIEAIEEGG